MTKFTYMKTDRLQIIRNIRLDLSNVKKEGFPIPSPEGEDENTFISKCIRANLLASFFSSTNLKQTRKILIGLTFTPQKIIIFFVWLTS